MTEPTTAGAGSRSRRGVVFGAVVAVALVVVALVAGRSGSAGGPLSPRSTSSDGTKALVLLLQENGAQVDLGASIPPSQVDGTAMLLRDQLSDSQHDTLLRWVSAGGTLVVADPTSPLVPIGQDDVVGAVIQRGDDCDVSGLQGVNQLVLRDDDVQFDSVRYATSEAYTSCFGGAREGFVVRMPQGRGAVVAVGGQGPFTNGLLDEADNAVLAVRLLTPLPQTTIAIYNPAQAGQGQTTLVDLMPERVVQAVIQAGIALLLYVLWRLRRLGAPVVEPQPVDIPGSELVRAVGSLQARAHGHGRAGAVLQTDTRRRLALRYGLPANAPPDVVAAAVSAHSSLDPARVSAAIGPTAASGSAAGGAGMLDDEGLLALAQELDGIREEVLDGSS